MCFWVTVVDKAPIFTERDIFEIGKYLRSYSIPYAESKRRVDGGEDIPRDAEVKRDLLILFTGVRFGLRRSDLAKINLSNFDFDRDGPYERWNGGVHCRLGARKAQSL